MARTRIPARRRGRSRLRRARDALRACRAKRHGGLPAGGAVIEFADGVYPFAVPLELDSRDAGTSDAPVVWRAAHFNCITNNVTVFGRESFGNWKFVKDTCTVTNNLALDADPGFIDYANFDWRLRPGPARDLIGGLPIGRMGLYASPVRVSPPVRFGADVTPPPPLQKVYDPAVVRIDLVFQGSLPTNVAGIAADCIHCGVPDWSRGKCVMASFGTASLERWKSYTFTFTPRFDQTLVLDTMGARGEKTLYDDFRVTGATLKNGGFEEHGVWRGGVPHKGDYRAPLCNLARPYGVVTASEAGVPAAEGARMACGSDMINFSQPFQVKKGVPVTIAFKARALPLRSSPD